MKLKSYLILVSLVFLIPQITIATSVVEWPKGVTTHNPSKAYNGFTLYTPLAGNGTHYLINMQGDIIHTWKLPPAHYGKLLKNGNLLTGILRKEGLGTVTTKTSAVATVGEVLEVDWNGKVVSRWSNNAIHHDFEKLPNGNLLTLLWSKHKRPSEVRGGISGTEYKDGVILSETIAEITHEGEIVWRWVAEDQLDPNDFPICPLDYRRRWLHANSIQYLPPENPILRGEELILVSFRQSSACVIINKHTGEVIWRYGGYLPDEYGKLGHQHSFHMINEKELPGFGNFLIFDNGMHVAGLRDWGLPRSKVVEIKAKTKKIVWAFSHEEQFGAWMPPEWKFFSPYISGAQRLANGNTLICEGGTGRLFEVTQTGELVWEYLNPSKEALFRAYRYGPEFPGFLGKDLPKPQ